VLVGTYHICHSLHLSDTIALVNVGINGTHIRSDYVGLLDNDREMNNYAGPVTRQLPVSGTEKYEKKIGRFPDCCLTPRRTGRLIVGRIQL
jgi:hypothetical protein